MNKALKNAKAVRLYVEYMRNAKRRAEATIVAVERALCTFEKGSKLADFAQFDRHAAKRFTSWLEEEGPSGKGTSAKQMYQTLHHVRSFLQWLAFRPGYKSRIQLNDIDYLSMDRKKMQEVTGPNIVDWPSKEHVLKLTGSIKPESEADRRDRALISFLLLSGMRETAVATLPLGCFDQKELEVYQFPEKGVQTKFSKKMISHLFVFDDKLLGYILDWAEYLAQEREFSASDPMFPRSRVVRCEESGEFASPGVEPVFWESGGPVRDILVARSMQAGLPYFKPHCFRHAASQLANLQCSSFEELRAISQNLGHENVGTTLTSYGKLGQERISKVVHAIDFQSDEEEVFDEVFERKLRLLVAKKKKK